MSLIRTAVVGLGMGRNHAYAYHRAARADLRWVVDLNSDLAAQVAGELGCRHTADFTAILDDVDAVSICTPHHLHAPQALEAISAGKHVLLEKPLANSEAGCRRIIAAAAEKNVKLMCAYSVRYLPAVVRLKEALEKEEFGKVFNANCWIETYLSPRPGTWFARKDQLGGGVLFSHGCHYVDLLIWLLGTPRRVASLGTRLGTDWLEGEGTAHSVIEFESGALGYLETSWGMRFKDTKALMHLHTPEAVLILGYNKLEAITADGRKSLYERPPGKPEPGDSVIHEIEHFIDCIEHDLRPVTDGPEAMKSLRTIWAMYSAQGTPVDVYRESAPA